MNRRPLLVTIVAGVYILAGAAGFAYHLPELAHPFQSGAVWIELVRVLALVCGVFLLRASDWARWLALAWIAFHVIVSAFHSLPEFAMHALFCALIAWALFRPASARYFRSAGSAARTTAG